ncbi:MAG TPA: SIS domain-containing protein [bacterium]|nr:SIS domain-containing protein [bacterium]
MKQVTGRLDPLPTDYVETLNFVLSQGPQVQALVASLRDAGMDRVYLVGAGGSLANMYPLSFLLNQHATSFASQLLTSAEFVISKPAALGPRSLVVVVSHKGETPETVEAAGLASARGARVVALTRMPDSRLGAAADVVFTTHSERTITEAKLLLLHQLGLSLLARFGQCNDYAGAMAALAALPPALHRVKQETEAENAETAARLKDEPLIYTLSAGPNYGVGYALAMCALQEQQWIHAAAVNAAEFFHGAFEIVEEGTPLIVLLGEDVSRPIAERALRFAQRYSRKVVAIDTKDKALPGIADPYRGLVSPLVLSAMTTRLLAHFAAVRGHSVQVRRYMFKVEY